MKSRSDNRAASMEFPKDLRHLPEAVAREVYIHRVICSGLPGIFFREFEQRQQARRDEEVAFRFVDAIYFFAQAAAAGVVGNLAYSAVAAAVRAVRKPKLELGGRSVTFDAVVSRKTYNRLRTGKHKGKAAKRGVDRTFEQLDERIRSHGKPKSVIETCGQNVISDGRAHRLCSSLSADGAHRRCCKVCGLLREPADRAL